MRNLLDFSSWGAVLSTLPGLVMVTAVAVGIRLLVMQRVQQRRERQNRQINERLTTLIAVYKTLGSSFTDDLAVDPSHLRDQRLRATTRPAEGEHASEPGNTKRRHRIRDAVETALSDVILLGTAEQVGWLRRRPATWWPVARSKPLRWWCRCATSSARCSISRLSRTNW
jgi:hypothetical protein